MEPIDSDKLLNIKKKSGTSLITEQLRRQIEAQKGRITAISEGMKPEELEKTFSDAEIYTVPIGFIDYADKTTFQRVTEGEILNDPETLELMDSLKQFGQLDPVDTFFNDQHRLAIADGWRRSLSLRQVAFDSIKVKILKMTKDEAGIYAAVKNFNRKGISDADKALYILKLNREMLLPTEKIATSLGVKQRRIQKILDIFDYKPIEEALKTRVISLNAAIRCAEVASGIPEESLKAMVKKLASTSLKISDLKKFVDEGKVEEKGQSLKHSPKKGPKEKDILEVHNDGEIVFKFRLKPNSTKPEYVDFVLEEIKRAREEVMRFKAGLKSKGKKGK